MKDDMNGGIYGFLTKLGIWVIAFGIMFIWAIILFAPAFLPWARREVTECYSKFRYKDALVEEEMQMLTRWAWGLCIVGWAATIFVLLKTGL